MNIKHDLEAQINDYFTSDAGVFGTAQYEHCKKIAEIVYLPESFVPAHKPLTNRQWLQDTVHHMPQTPPLQASEPGVLLSAVCCCSSCCV